MKILIAGDFAPKERMLPIIKGGNGLDALREIPKYLKGVDYSIVNLEAPYCKDLNQPIKKRGPHLHSPKGTIELIKQIGFNAVTLANNHIKDFGETGISETIEELNLNKLEHVGAGMNLKEAEQPLVKNIGGHTVSIISICENEYSIATNTTAGAAPINPIKNFNQIVAAKEISDYVIVVTHGGHEHYQLPSPRMKELYHFFIDSGASAVVNHHQHCFSGYEYYKGQPIIYGLGNFCFDSKKRMNSIWNYGYLAILNIIEGQIKVETIPYEQALEDIAIKPLNGEMKEDFNKKIESLNSIITNQQLLESEYKKFIQRKKKAVLGVFAPYPSEILRELASRNHIPNLLSYKQVATLLNYIECESQRDATIGVLKNLLK